MPQKWINNRFIFISSILLSIVLYYPSYRAGLVTDWLSWYYWYNEGDFGDIIHCFNYRGLHQFFHLIHYPIFKISGNSGFLWYVFYAIMHGVNVFLIFRAIQSLIRLFKVDHSFGIAFFTALIFLISPFHVEVLVWKVCFHYMLVLALFLISLQCFIRWIDSRNNKHLLIYLLSLCCSLFTLEIALIYPIIYAGLLVCYLRVCPEFHLTIKEWFKLVGLPFMMLLGWFTLNKLMFTDWVGHYGAEKHLNFDFWLISGNMLKYIAKYVGFAHYWSFQQKMDVYELLEVNHSVILIGVSTIIASSFILWYFIKKLHNAWALILWSFVGFFVALAPVANLYFARIMPYENDRYGYVASLFLYFFLVLIVYRLKPMLRYFIVILIFVVHAYFFRYMITNAYHAGKVMEGLVEDFDFYNCKQIYILGDPENYHGMSMLRDYSDRSIALRESLDILKEKSFEGTIFEVGQVNMYDAQDGVEVNQIDSVTINVINTDPGTWFWRKGLGMSDYSRDEYKVTMHGWYFEVKFKEVPRDACFIYSNGAQWMEHSWDIHLEASKE